MLLCLFVLLIVFKINNIFKSYFLNILGSHDLKFYLKWFQKIFFKTYLLLRTLKKNWIFFSSVIKFWFKDCLKIFKKIYSNIFNEIFYQYRQLLENILFWLERSSTHLTRKFSFKNVRFAYFKSTQILYKSSISDDDFSKFLNVLHVFSVGQNIICFLEIYLNQFFNIKIAPPPFERKENKRSFWNSFKTIIYYYLPP